MVGYLRNKKPPCYALLKIETRKGGAENGMNILKKLDFLDHKIQINLNQIL